MNQYKIELTFTEPLLGTVPLNREIYADYIASRIDGINAMDEVETIEEATEKGTTGFHRQDGTPAVYDYAVKGMFKDAAGMLRRVPGTASVKLTAYKKIIDGLVFVTPRLIPLTVAGELGILERPLRAQTAQGERVSLARSEMAPVGSVLAFTVQVLGKDVTEETLREWLDYGSLRGMGQWRNGGYGRYSYTLAVA
jgi:hypothetical protein